ncbi:MAG: type I-E CRISPR-associated protein Cse2/CasB [Alphaproteobacteria bacterium]|nr:type I-E CRISPR-associated protein Cse2/CasB [Alphaproteobacteria bacterium]
MTDSKLRNDAAVAAAWWRELTANDSHGRRTRGARRAALARLRRAATPVEVILEPEALRLLAALSGKGHAYRERAAILAGVLAAVREEDSQPVMRALGRFALDDAESARMSEARFRRLLQAEEDTQMDAMRRLVRLAGGKVDVYDLSDAILHWGERIKRRWIFRYYNVEESLRLASGEPQSRTRTPAT